MKKRIIAAFLCLTMIFSTVGCQKEMQASPAEGTPLAEEEKTASKTAAEEKAAVPEPVSMEDNYRTYYEVFVYSFYDGNGDGIGDLQGLTQKLDYINDGNPETDGDLGCNGIWLMPVMPSPSYHKYDVTDYYGIDAQYGTMEDFEAFITACNERGIKVILDLVINHSSSLHPWFQEACSYLAELGDGEPSAEECPYVDYYHFSKENQSGYCQVPGSDVWYYEAQFYYGMPDLNLSNEKLREEIEHIADFWLEKGVGGFRLDAAKEYVSGGKDANIEILQWFCQMVKEKKEDAYLVAEVWTDINTYAEYYDSGIDSVFNFSFADSSGIIANVIKGSSPASNYTEALVSAQELFAAHNPDYIDAPFYTNHDMGRSAGYYAGEQSEAQTKMAGALNLFMSGSAFIYYGEELGMKGAGKDENKRAPMYFSSEKNEEGMCKGPADMDDVKMKYASLAEQETDPYSIYQYYKRAIYLRNLYPAIRKGSVENLAEYSSDSVAAFRKSWEEEKLMIFCNVSEKEAALDLSQMENVPKKIENALYTGEEQAVYEEGRLTIPAYGIVLMSQ